MRIKTTDGSTPCDLEVKERGEAIPNGTERKKKIRKLRRKIITQWFTRDLRLRYKTRTNTLISSAGSYQWWINTRSATTFQCFSCFASSTWNNQRNKRTKTGLRAMSVFVCVCVCAYVNTVQSAIWSHTFFFLFLARQETTHFASGTISAKVRKKKRKNYNNQQQSPHSVFGPTCYVDGTQQSLCYIPRNIDFKVNSITKS